MPEQSVRGAQRLKARLQQIRVGAKDVVSDRDDAIKNLLVRRNLERFDRQVDPDEVAWPKLDENTVKQKGRRGSPQPDRVLFDSGHLRNSIGVIRGSAVFAVSTGAGFRIGITDSSAFYGRFHALGIGQVQRRFLGINSKDIQAVNGLLRRAIARVTR